MMWGSLTTDGLGNRGARRAPPVSRFILQESGFSTHRTAGSAQAESDLAIEQGPGSLSPSTRSRISRRSACEEAKAAGYPERAVSLERLAREIEERG